MVLLIYVMDRPSRLKHENMKEIVLDNLALINADKQEELLLDLKQKTGIPFQRVEIKSIDFFKETAKINAFYYSTVIEKSSIQDSDDF
jgi:predicted nucleic acid-binding protein